VAKRVYGILPVKYTDRFVNVSRGMDVCIVMSFTQIAMGRSLVQIPFDVRKPHSFRINS